MVEKGTSVFLETWKLDKKILLTSEQKNYLKHRLSQRKWVKKYSGYFWDCWKLWNLILIYAFLFIANWKI